MCLAHLLKGCQLNDCDATSRYTSRSEAAARGLSESKDCSFAARPAVPKDHLRQLARCDSLRDELSLFTVVGWIFLLCTMSENPTGMGNPHRGNAGNGNISEGIPSVDLLRREGKSPPRTCRRWAKPALTQPWGRSRCRKGRDPQSEYLPMPKHPCLVCPIWPIVRERMLAWGLSPPSLQSPNPCRHLRSREANRNWSAAYKLGARSVSKGVSVSKGGLRSASP